VIQLHKGAALSGVRAFVMSGGILPAWGIRGKGAATSCALPGAPRVAEGPLR
jgi:hypothetical protein